MRFRETVERKGSDVENDLVLGFAGEALGSHAFAKAFFDLHHALGGALEAHGSAQFLGLTAAETRSDHRDLEQLFLKNRDAQCSFENRSQRFVGVDDGLPSGSAIEIGMDHFALPGDELSVAMSNGSLSRNFMGYTTKRGTEMVALGSSGISDVADAYAQNHKRLNSYYQSIEAGKLPVERGVSLSDDDQIRRHVITELMCNSYLSFPDVEQRFRIDFHDYFGKELATMAGPGGAVEEGMAAVANDHITATELGTVFIRNVAMTFDVYLKKVKRDKPVFSRTV